MVGQHLLASSLRAVMRASQAVASSLDLEYILRAIVEQASQISGAPVVRLFLLEEDGRVLRFRVAVGLPPDAERELSMAVGQGFTGAVAATGRPVMVGDTRGDPRVVFPEHRERHGLVSYLGLPVIMGTRLLGVLVFNSPVPRVYSEDDLAVLDIFAQQAAIALEHAQLHEAAVRRGRQTEALLQTHRSLMADLDLVAILDRILDEAARISGCSHVKVVLLDGERQILRVAAARGSAHLRGEQIPLTGSLSGLVIRTRSPVFVPDCDTDVRNAFREDDRRLGLVTFLGLPVIFRQESLGVLTLNTSKPRHYTGEEIGYLQTFADQAAVAIENARLHAAVSLRAEQLAALSGLTQSVMRGMDLEAVGREIMAAARTLIPESAVRLWGVTGAEETLELIASTGLRNPLGGKLRFPKGEGLAGLAAITRQPVFSADVVRDPRYVNKAWAETEGLVSGIVFPLVSGDRMQGLLATFTRVRHIFTETEMALLESLSAHAGIALEKVRHAKELEAQVQARTTELQALNRDLEAFAYSVSHDLRAPLRGASILADVLLKDHLGDLPPDGQGHLRLMRGRLQRMAKLIEDLLAFSRSGRHPLGKQRVLPAAIVRQVWEELQPERQDRRVDMVVPDDLPPCEADPALLEQVFVNLLSNALKFTRTREVARVEVGAVLAANAECGMRNAELPVQAGAGQSAIRNPQSEIVYYVRDNGVGFDMRYASKLFGVFRRLHRSQDYEGTGVGLAIVQRIVERHGGRIWAEGAPDQGATFSFTLTNACGRDQRSAVSERRA